MVVQPSRRMLIDIDEDSENATTRVTLRVKQR